MILHADECRPQCGRAWKRAGGLGWNLGVALIAAGLLGWGASAGVATPAQSPPPPPPALEQPQQPQPQVLLPDADEQVEVVGLPRPAFEIDLPEGWVEQDEQAFSQWRLFEQAQYGLNRRTLARYFLLDEEGRRTEAMADVVFTAYAHMGIDHQPWESQLAPSVATTAGIETQDLHEAELLGQMQEAEALEFDAPVIDLPNRRFRFGFEETADGRTERRQVLGVFGRVGVFELVYTDNAGQWQQRADQRRRLLGSFNLVPAAAYDEQKAHPGLLDRLDAVTAVALGAAVVLVIIMIASRLRRGPQGDQQQQQQQQAPPVESVGPAGPVEPESMQPPADSGEPQSPAPQVEPGQSPSQDQPRGPQQPSDPDRRG